MMNMSGPEKTTKPLQSGSAVRCAKCGHTNAHGLTECESCGAHLHVLCHKCGHRNERVRSRCTECGHRLHRSLSRRLTHRILVKNRVFRSIFGRNRTLSLIQIVLLLLGILVGYYAIRYFAEFKPPEPEGRYAPFLPAERTSNA